MFPSYAYPSAHQRRHSQSPSFFNFVDQSPFTPSCFLQPDSASAHPPPHRYSFAQPDLYAEQPRHRSRNSGWHAPHPDADAQGRRAQQLRVQRQQRERELEQEAQYQRELSRLRNHPAEYQDAVRAERARRLGEAKQRQRSAAMGPSEPAEPQVEVTMPDGRRCVVPLSWAQKMQAKYPSILTDAMIRPVREPVAQRLSPEPMLAGEENSEHGSDFYVLDPSQDPSVPVLAPRSPAPPARPQPSAEERDAAARLIQHQFRLHQRLRLLGELESKLRTLTATFVRPSPDELTFLTDPAAAGDDEAPATKLAYNNPSNRPVQALEESLLQLQIQLDGIVSGGNERVKALRKRLVKEVEQELEALDRFKSDAWMAQRAARVSKQTEGEHDPQPMDGVEQASEAHEVTNTDSESIASDSPTHPSCPADAGQEDIIIPVSPAVLQSDDALVVPKRDHVDQQQRTASTSVLAPLRITDEGDIVCPSVQTISEQQNVLVSPI